MEEPTELVDVDRLVEDLRERADRERRDGPGSSLSPPGRESPGTSPLTGQVGEHRLEIRPELYKSTRPLIGPVLSFAKHLLLRFLFIPLQAWFAEEAVARGAALQVEADARARDVSALAWEVEKVGDVTGQVIGQAIGPLETVIDQLEIAHRVGASEMQELAESLRQAMNELRDRVELLTTNFDRLQIAVRLARLEREQLTRGTAPARPAPRQEARATEPHLDYMTFEGRFRPDGTVKARQEIYLDVLRGRRRVVDLGCGRGELLELLAEADVSAYGVDVDRDFIALTREKGLEVVEEDALEHVERLEEGAVDAITASHLIEHLPAHELVGLISTAHDRLDTGGILIMETPNPESIVAGSINFHRDPTHNRPIHPDTLEFLCESAGFREVVVKRLAETPQSELLPPTNLRSNPLAGHLDVVVDRLNKLLYGYQDYAVLAWK
jgi:2-polyprenyl-3-methyl-5-hydroxy-6-metoxy-1,4-benzoquinol methylase